MGGKLFHEKLCCIEYCGNLKSNENIVWENSSVEWWETVRKELEFIGNRVELENSIQWKHFESRKDVIESSCVV